MRFLKLKKGLFCHSGRNNTGCLVFRRRGGGFKSLYRFVDYNLKLSQFLPFIILDFTYDSYRNNYLMLIFYFNGIFSYRVLIEKVEVGNVFSNFGIFVGNVLGLNQVPLGREVCLVSNRINKSKFVRAAGAASVLLKVDYDLGIALLRFPSGNKYLLSVLNRAVLGRVNNLYFSKAVYGNAGKRRRMGYKQVVRGIARNPVDHPNGGRTPGGKVYRSFSGLIARSSKPTARKSFSNIFLKKNYNKKALLL